MNSYLKNLVSEIKFKVPEEEIKFTYNLWEKKSYIVKEIRKIILENSTNATGIKQSITVPKIYTRLIKQGIEISLRWVRIVMNKMNAANMLWQMIEKGAHGKTIFFAPTRKQVIKFFDSKNNEILEQIDLHSQTKSSMFTRDRNSWFNKKKLRDKPDDDQLPDWIKNYKA